MTREEAKHELMALTRPRYDKLGPLDRQHYDKLFGGQRAEELIDALDHAGLKLVRA